MKISTLIPLSPSIVSPATPFAHGHSVRLRKNVTLGPRQKRSSTTVSRISTHRRRVRHFRLSPGHQAPSTVSCSQDFASSPDKPKLTLNTPIRPDRLVRSLPIRILSMTLGAWGLLSSGLGFLASLICFRGWLGPSIALYWIFASAALCVNCFVAKNKLLLVPLPGFALALVYVTWVLS